jgi:hypothetical protein
MQETFNMVGQVLLLGAGLFILMILLFFIVSLAAHL